MGEDHRRRAIPNRARPAASVAARRAGRSCSLLQGILQDLLRPLRILEEVQTLPGPFLPAAQPCSDLVGRRDGEHIGVQAELQLRVVPEHLLFNFLYFAVQPHLPALVGAKPDQPLGIEEQDVLVLPLRQPDDEIRVIGVVLEERDAVASAHVADQEQLPLLQARVAAFR